MVTLSPCTSLWANNLIDTSWLTQAHKSGEIYAQLFGLQTPQRMSQNRALREGSILCKLSVFPGHERLSTDLFHTA